MPRFNITVTYKTRTGLPKSESMELWSETGEEAKRKVLRRIKHNCLASNIVTTCTQVK